ncbi:hypothetical protein I0Q12_08375 [Rhodococcus sp. CX]|uniref:hypothetical protein n=1 Tax=Rhodococcus sp. CX TaxID=2789880 RepID=UPI0018CF4DFB|nr:hypothetical protein [Rhodococcus sp. CX]MBH0119536.1 hypothetical protein [Rhodococcus sp. CX]
MKITVEYPVDGAEVGLLTKRGMDAVVRRVDELDLDVIAFTEHPVEGPRRLRRLVPASS